MQASCFSHDSESDADDDNLESEEESESCSDAEEDTSNEGENDEVGSDENGVDVRSSSVAFKQLAPHLEEYGIVSNYLHYITKIAGFMCHIY